MILKKQIVVIIRHLNFNVPQLSKKHYYRPIINTRPLLTSAWFLKYQTLEELNKTFVSVGPKLAIKLGAKSDNDPIKEYAHYWRRAEVLIESNEWGIAYFSENAEKWKDIRFNWSSNKSLDAAKLLAKLSMMILNASETGNLSKHLETRKNHTNSQILISKWGNNYGPISFLSVFPRLFEKLMHEQLSYFVLSKRKLTVTQFAYCKLHLTIISLISASDYWHENISKNNVNFALFLDRFDTIDCEILSR